jgi:hypothetical protein
MATRRRLALISVPLVLALSAVLGQVAVAQGPGGFKPAGNYNNTSMLASFNFSPSDPTQTSVSLFVNRQTVVGPSGTTDETSWFLDVSTNNGFGTPNVRACGDLANAGDFNVASNVQSASLHTTIPPNSPCGSVASNLTVDITWTGSGPIQTTHTTSRFSCSGYTDESQGSDSNNAGAATFNIDGLVAPITTAAPQVFHFGSSVEHAQGAVPPDSCRAGVGKGAGRPTPAAGNYHTTFQDANLFSFSGSFLELDVARSTNVANPLVGASTSSDQTEFVLGSSSVSTGGCFVFNPQDFTITASSASLHTILTGNTPACNGATNSVSPDPFPVDLLWVGTSPVATTKTDSQYSCLGYRFQTSTVQVADGVADVTVSMPGLTATFPAGSFGSVDTRTHADGTPAPGCFFRG